MRGNELLKSLSEVDNDLILESENAFGKKKKTFRVKRWIAVAACLCLLCSVPVLAAAGNAPAYEALYSISPSIAQKLKPVNASCEDKGIVMNVIAAETDGEKATVLISMRDNEGNRLDETTDLFDSYSIHTPYDQSGGCSFVDYDDDTGTATFMLTIEQMHHVLIPGDKLTFSVSQLLSNKEHDILRLTQIDTENVRSVSVDDDMFMQPDEANAVSLISGVSLTGYGVADGKLHIQLRFDDILNTDNHGFAYLKTKDGEIINCQSNNTFWDDSHVNRYEEYVFPVSAEELGDYEIWGEFWICNSGPIKGNWQVTFPMTDKD